MTLTPPARPSICCNFLILSLADRDISIPADSSATLICALVLLGLKDLSYFFSFLISSLSRSAPFLVRRLRVSLPLFCFCSALRIFCGSLTALGLIPNSFARAFSSAFVRLFLVVLGGGFFASPFICSFVRLARLGFPNFAVRSACRINSPNFFCVVSIPNSFARAIVSALVLLFLITFLGLINRSLSLSIYILCVKNLKHKILIYISLMILILFLFGQEGEVRLHLRNP